MKFLDYLYQHRKYIGYTIGVLNLVAALNYFYLDLIGLGVLWTVIGAYIIYDMYNMEKNNGKHL